jgi:dipeptidyl aminopeptidase/acylaminoacyl peptidase
MQERVSIDSAGLKLSAVLHLPQGHQPGQKHPAIIVVHGFGANKDAGNVTVPASLYAQWGYIALRVDMRGCGESQGKPGHVLCTDQVEDVQSAISYLAQRPDVMADRIALSGTSFGGAVVLYTAGVDARVAAVISAGGWGNGERKLEGQHPTPGGWDKFKRMLQEGREHKAKTGTSMMVHRFDIVPIPPHLRGGLPATAVMQFPVDTAQSIFDFRPDDVIGHIAPRPVLFLHAAPDSVTPTSESVAMFQRAKAPAELHLFNGVDHFMLSENNPRVNDLLHNWLGHYFPLPAP